MQAILAGDNFLHLAIDFELDHGGLRYEMSPF
jgi:hypothetical protein